MKHLSAALAAAALIATSLPLAVAGAAVASDDDETIRRGTCTNGVTWKMKAKPDDGRIEVEAEIDTNRPRQRWAWVLRHNGSVSARGTSTTNVRSGSFEVERRTVNSPGTDFFRFRATRNGVVCVARVRL